MGSIENKQQTGMFVMSQLMIGSCKNCGHALILRGDVLLHAIDNYSGKLCMYVSRVLNLEKHCNCINPELPKCEKHDSLLSVDTPECVFCISEQTTSEKEGQP